MKRTTTLLSTLLLAAGLFAQTPCIDGFADGYPCNGVSLVRHMTMDELGAAPGIGLNDIWGWTDVEFCKEYALVGRTDGTAFVDITDALNPCYIGTLPTHTTINAWRDIKVYDDHAFIVSEASGHGMQVFDLTRLRDAENVPTVFDADAHFDGFGNSHNIAMNPETGYAYPVGTTDFAGGPHFINVQAPLNPTAEGGYEMSGYSHDAQIIIYDGPDTEHVGSEIYFGAHGSNGTVVIVDVTDKTDPTLLSSSLYENSVYAHQGWVTTDHRYFLHNDEVDEGTFDYNTRTRVWDIADLDNPIEMQFFESAIASTDHNHYVKGDYLFQSNYTGGLRILDLSDIANENITETAFFDVHPENDFNGYSGTWSNYPYFSSGNIVVTHRQDGLYIVKPDDAAIVNATDPVYTRDCGGVVGEGESIFSLCNTDIAESVSEFEGTAFEVFPNPASTQLAITADERIELIELIDLSGKTVLSYSPQSISSPINISVTDIAEGIYALRINGQSSGSQLVSIAH